MAYLEGRLKLKVNREKSAVDRPWKRKFLGYSFLTNKRAPIRRADKTLETVKTGLGHASASCVP